MLDYFLVSSRAVGGTYSAPSRENVRIANKMSLKSSYINIAYIIDPEWFIKFDQSNIIGISTTNIILFMHYDSLCLTGLTSAIYCFMV